MNIAGVLCLMSLVFSLDAVSAMESKNAPDAFRAHTAVYWREDGTAAVYDMSDSNCADEESQPMASVVIDSSRPDILHDLLTGGQGELPDSLVKFLNSINFWRGSQNGQNSSENSNPKNNS